METPFLLHPDEQLSLSTRQSLLAFAFPLLGVAVWFLATFFFMTALVREGVFGQSVFGILLGGALWCGARLWRRVAGTKLFVTTERLVYVHTKGLFGKTTSEIPFANLAAVSLRRKSFGELVARYGSLVVEEKGGRRMSISRLPHLQDVYDRVSYLLAQRLYEGHS